MTPERSLEILEQQREEEAERRRRVNILHDFLAEVFDEWSADPERCRAIDLHAVSAPLSTLVH